MDKMTLAPTKSIFIGGEWQKINPEQTETIYNPATMEPIAKVAYGGKEEAKMAIEAATKAFKTWGQKTGRERSHVLYKAAELLKDDAERSGKMLTTEQEIGRAHV